MSSKTGTRFRILRVVVRLVLSVHGLLFAGTGAYFVAYGAHAWSEALASEGWPVVRATVVNTALDHNRRSRGHYTPKVVYHYTVGDVAFTGERLRILGDGMPEAEARQILARFAPGREVDVHVNPRAPEASVLIPGAGWGVYAGFAIALPGAVVGALMLYVAWSGRLFRADEHGHGRTGHDGDQPAADNRSLGPRELETLRARFRPQAAEYRRRTQRFWLALPVYVGCGVMAVLFDTHPGVVLLFAAAAIATFVFMVRALPRLPPCPACAGALESHIGHHCPGCGSRFTRAAGWSGSRRCDACGKVMGWMPRGGRRYRIHACTHCGVMLDAAGL